MADQVVFHPKYGRGVVKGQLHRGFTLYVVFGDGIKRLVDITEVEKLQQTQAQEARGEVGESASIRPQAPRAIAATQSSAMHQSPRAEPPPASRQKAPSDGDADRSQPCKRRSAALIERQLADCARFRSRRIVEALRLGIVPDDCVEEMTVGRDREVSILRRWLDQGGGSALVVGNYGSGKSHLLQYLSVAAAKLGYAVACVQMEPNEAPLHKPKRIYRAVAANLRYSDSGGLRVLGFRDLLQGILDRGALHDHPYFARLKDQAAVSEQYRHLFWEWIEASEDTPRPVAWQEDYYGYRYNRFGYVPPLHVHTTAANIYCNLLSALSWAATHVLGLTGLLVLVDEAESLDVNASRLQIERGANFLRALVGAANDDECLLAAPAWSELTYSRTGIGPRIPFLHRKPCRLKLAWALTPTVLLDHLPELYSALRIDIEPLDIPDLEELYLRVWQHYEQAYGIVLGDEQQQRTFRDMGEFLPEVGGDIRWFVKACVEILDDLRYDSE